MYVSNIELFTEPEPPTSPCSPSPCGPHSVCQVKMGRPVCSCSSTFVGSPPNCRPECLISQECSIDQACMAHKCMNPCPESCGPNSDCTVISHTPYCSCKIGYEGDAFVGCTAIIGKKLGDSCTDDTAYSLEFLTKCFQKNNQSDVTPAPRVHAVIMLCALFTME